jgi:carboxypeptidase D
VSQQCPKPFDPLGFTNPLPPNIPIYFDRDDVKAAIHAPLNASWRECEERIVFVPPLWAGPEGGGDRAPDPTQSVLPGVIERTNRTLISNGNLDFLIQTNGTLMAIQNMTWNGRWDFSSISSTILAD